MSLNLSYNQIIENLENFYKEASSFLYENLESVSVMAGFTFLAVFLAVALIVVPYLLKNSISSAAPPSLAVSWRQFFSSFLPRLRPQDNLITKTWIPGVGPLYLINTAQSEAGASWALENSAASLVNGYYTGFGAVGGKFLRNKAIHPHLNDAACLAWTKKAYGQILPADNLEVQKLNAKKAGACLNNVLKNWGTHGSLEHSLDSFQRLVAEINTSLFLGEYEADIAGSLTRALSADNIKANCFTPGTEFVAAVDKLANALVQDAAESRKTRPAYLIDLVEKYTDDKTKRVNSAQVASLLFAVLVTATRNTAAAITSCLFLIASNPEISQKVLAEADKQSVALAKTGQTSLTELADNYPLLNACIKETQRLTDHSIALRKTTERVKLGKYVIPPNSLIAIDYRPLFTNSDIFAAPKLFRPARFLPSETLQKVPANAAEEDQPLLLTPPKQDRVERVASLAYGGGQHPCPGSELANGTIALVLATILNRYKVAISLPVLEPLSGKPIHLPPNGLSRRSDSPVSTPVAPLELYYSLRA